MRFLFPLRWHIVFLGLSVLAVARSGATAAEHLSFRISEDVVTQEGYRRTVRLREGQIHILHALPKSRTVDLSGVVPTKTGAVWSIRIGRPLEGLLFRQRQRSNVGRKESWVFPNSKGGHLNYRWNLSSRSSG